MSYVSNNDKWITNNIGTFHLEQRNVGFADNDGRWVVTQSPELYWSASGVLYYKARGAFLGVFDTETLALVAVESAERQPEVNKSVDSFQR